MDGGFPAGPGPAPATPGKAAPQKPEKRGLGPQVETEASTEACRGRGGGRGRECAALAVDARGFLATPLPSVAADREAAFENN